MGYDITAFLDEQVGRGAGRTALTFEGQHTSFGALDQRVKRLAGALRQAGLEARKDARVFVLDKNHPATIELTLAAAKAGVTCVIGNWRLAAEEIAWAVNDSRARILFLGHELTSALGSIRVSMPSLERVVVVGGKDDGYEAFLASGQPLDTPATHEDDDWRAWLDLELAYDDADRRLACQDRSRVRGLGCHVGSIPISAA